MLSGLGTLGTTAGCVYRISLGSVGILAYPYFACISILEIPSTAVHVFFTSDGCSKFYFGFPHILSHPYNIFGIFGSGVQEIQGL